MSVGKVSFKGVATSQQNQEQKVSFREMDNTLERNPIQDTVSFSGNNKEQLLNGCDVDVSNGFLGLGKRKIQGSINGVPVDLKVDTGFFTSNVKLTGMVNGKPVDLQLKNYKLTGNIAEEDKNLLPYLQKFMKDKRSYDEMMATVAICA